MKKKIIISSESTNLFTSKRFETEITNLGYIPHHINPYQSSMKTSKELENLNQIELFLHRTSGIRYDDYDLLVANKYKDDGIRIINDVDKLIPFRQKDSQLFYLKKHHFNIIPTFTFRGSLANTLSEEIFNISKNEEYILKMNRGNGGIGVQYIKTFKSLMSVLETYQAINDQKMIIQPFFEHAKEFRLFVTNKLEMYLIEKEISSSDFRGNKARSTAKLISNIPNDIKTVAIDLIEKTQLSYLGIDLFYYHNELYILEVNSVPGFEQVENLANKNIAREILLLK